MRVTDKQIGIALIGSSVCLVIWGGLRVLEAHTNHLNNKKFELERKELTDRLMGRA